MNPTSTAPASPVAAATAVELTAAQLPAFCPNPAMPVWNHHPRVFLDVTRAGGAMCPYCGTRYRLQAGETVRGGH